MVHDGAECRLWTVSSQSPEGRVDAPKYLPIPAQGRGSSLPPSTCVLLLSWTRVAHSLSRWMETFLVPSTHHQEVGRRLYDVKSEPGGDVSTANRDLGTRKGVGDRMSVFVLAVKTNVAGGIDIPYIFLTLACLRRDETWTERSTVYRTISSVAYPCHFKLESAI